MNERDDSELRALWREQETDDVEKMKLAALRQKGTRLTRKLAVRKWSETIAGGASIVVLARIGFGLPGMPLVKLGCVMLIVGQLVVLANLWRRGTPRPAPPITASTVEFLAYYRAELVRERDLLWSVARWYLAPTAPGLLFLPIAVCITVGGGALWVGGTTLASVALVYAIVVALNRRASRKLGRELEALDARG